MAPFFVEIIISTTGHGLAFFSFGFSLCVTSFNLCDPLWFNDLCFTTKALKGFHKGTKRAFLWF